MHTFSLVSSNSLNMTLFIYYAIVNSRSFTVQSMYVLASVC